MKHQVGRQFYSSLVFVTRHAQHRRFQQPGLQTGLTGGQQLSLQVTLQRDRGHGRGQSAGEVRGRVNNPRSWGGGIT